MKYKQPYRWQSTIQLRLSSIKKISTLTLDYGEEVDLNEWFEVSDNTPGMKLHPPLAMK